MEYKKYYPEKKINFLISAPFIYMMIFPLLILDFFLEIYHHIAFPLYDIPMVKRSAYIKIDRHKLPYLTSTEKVNCAYCGYANGLIAYAAEIAARTEKYWCGIKHKQENDFVSPPHHNDFIEYGDKKAYEELSKKSHLEYETNLKL